MPDEVFVNFTEPHFHVRTSGLRLINGSAYSVPSEKLCGCRSMSTSYQAGLASASCTQYFNWLILPVR